MDLDVARRARAEKNGGPEPLILGGRTICELPAEFPLDVLEPLITGVDVDIARLIGLLLDSARADGDGMTLSQLADYAVDTLLAQPKLPAQLLAAVTEMAKRLFDGEDAYAAFVAARPSREDVAALLKGLFAKYGWSNAGDVLGESNEPDSGSPDGKTSTPTSSTTSTDSTSTESGTGLEIQGSSDSTDSSGYVTGSLPTPS
ncbi:hypothetical protein [Nonomuraea sp. NPDC003214]